MNGIYDDAEYAMCRVCHYDVLITHGGRNDLTRHEAGEKHRKVIEVQATTSVSTSNSIETYKVILLPLFILKILCMHGLANWLILTPSPWPITSYHIAGNIGRDLILAIW